MMLTVGFHEMWSHKRRLAGSMIAVVLGVAFLAGTLLLGDTLKANFDKLFTTANGSTDVILRGSTQIGSDINQSRSGVDASLLGLARSTPGVADAEPYVQGFGQLVGSNGKRIGGNGPPTTAANWVGVPSLNPYRIVAGHAPQADNEVVIIRGAAKTAKLHLGDTTTLLTPRPVRVTVVGISTFGTADGFGPSTFTTMTLHAATTYLTDDPNKVTQILIKAAPGVASQQLIGELQPHLPVGVQAITGTDLANENISDINSGFLGFLRNALTGFAVIALLVAVFSIYNTFSILGAQRSRSSALLRAIGATRRQVVTLGLSEALAVGVFGSVAGWAAGIAIAAGLKGMYGGFGFALPAGGLVFRAGSAAIAVLAGIAATLVAGIVPALRSSRVPPVAALRDQAAEPRSVSGRRAALGWVMTAGGVTTLVLAAARPGPVALAVMGAVLTLVGMVVLGPVVAPARGGRARRSHRTDARHHRNARAGKLDAQPTAYGGHRLGVADRGSRCGNVHRGGCVAQGIGGTRRGPGADRRHRGRHARLRRRRELTARPPRPDDRCATVHCGRRSDGDRSQRGRRIDRRQGARRYRGRPGSRGRCARSRRHVRRADRYEARVARGVGRCRQEQPLACRVGSGDHVPGRRPRHGYRRGDLQPS
jgi:putative ABC transport system permease protein